MKKTPYLSINIFAITLAIIIGFLFIGTIDVNAQNLNSPDQNITGVYEGPVEQNPINEWIQFAINTLTVVIISGSAVMIAVSGIQYMTARDNSQAVSAAKEKILNIVIGLGLYLFLYAFAQWLVPGGVF